MFLKFPLLVNLSDNLNFSWVKGYINWELGLLSELGFDQPSVRMLDDNSATVQLSFGTGKAGKSGHFRRMVAYLEGLTNRSIFWLDHTPSKENPSDIMTKSVSPADQFVRMRDIINGSNPVMFVSSKVRELCDFTSVSAGSILSIEGLDDGILDISLDHSADILEIDIDGDLNGSNFEIELNGSIVE